MPHSHISLICHQHCNLRKWQQCSVRWI
jgi:hypothetical protein